MLGNFVSSGSILLAIGGGGRVDVSWGEFVSASQLLS